jgi:hypothetical protein
MSGVATELEHEMEFQLEHEFEHESEHEQEAEHEAFFNHLAAMADRAGRSQGLRRIALAAARSALRASGRSYPVIEGEMEFEGEGELEAATALELYSTPAERAHLAAMMEHEGHAAAEAANEQEAAEHFLPLIPLAAKFIAPKLLSFAAKKIGGKFLGKAGSQLIRRAAPRILGRVAPRLTRGVANVARTLFRNPTTRPLLHAVPRIARGTMQTLVRRIARGRPVTPRFAVRTLARQTARTLSSPRSLAQTYRRSLAWDRRYHRQTRRFLGRPSGPMVRATYPMQPVGAYALPGSVVTAAAPFAAGGVVPTTGGCNCRCTCQPVTAGASAFPMGMPSVQPGFVPGVVSVCPTCGR